MIFKSPNYDDLFPNYPNVMFCQWEFTAPANQVILVEFNTFDLEEDDDFVYVGTTSGVGPDGRIFSHTGNAVPNTWVSTGNVVTLSMDTYKFNDNDYMGFQVTLSAVNPDGKEFCHFSILQNAQKLFKLLCIKVFTEGVSFRIMIA